MYLPCFIEKDTNWKLIYFTGIHPQKVYQSVSKPLRKTENSG